ncbi:hypothetical protein [Demequina aestuarii]|uniref:hypothetical protein n=1 Tax=Demequina aestuarii TaxID=327095 RepID=UPI000783AA26|nr:hypothetical protein [Demequina aestuarii]
MESAVAAGVRAWMLEFADEVGVRSGVRPAVRVDGDLGDYCASWTRPDGGRVQLFVANDVYVERRRATVEIGFGEPVESAFVVVEGGAVVEVLTQGEMVPQASPRLVERFLEYTQLGSGFGQPR